MLLDPLHCYEKFIHAVGDRHQPRKNIRPLRTIPMYLIQGKHAKKVDILHCRKRICEFSMM
jgi:hypothetical protein